MTTRRKEIARVLVDPRSSLYQLSVVVPRRVDLNRSEGHPDAAEPNKDAAEAGAGRAAGTKADGVGRL